MMMSVADDSRSKLLLWSAWVVAALALMGALSGWAYLVAVAGSALLVAALSGEVRRGEGRHDGRDLLAVSVLYIAVVALMRLAFTGFTTDRVAGLFLSFGAALLIGVAGPLFYMVWLRDRSPASLGLGAQNLRVTLVLAVAFAGVQFALTLWGYDLPATQNWVPLLCMALVVGAFESVFFRGFVQNILEAQFGPVIGIGGAALLYGVYHVGYGMGAQEMVFLTGLGVVYAVVFALVRNLLVLWPLLTPLGSFFANLEGGDIELPWASILGFADVFALMLAAWWFCRRHHHHHRHPRPAEHLRVSHHH